MFTPKGPSCSASSFSYKNVEEMDQAFQSSIPNISMSYIFIGITCILSLKESEELPFMCFNREDWTRDSKVGVMQKSSLVLTLIVDFEQMVTLPSLSFFLCRVRRLA